MWNKPNKKFYAIQKILNVALNHKKYKAEQVLKVVITKLGISEGILLVLSTLLDRKVQTLYHLAIDTVVEATSDNDS